MHLPSFPNVDLFSAGINALNGVFVARNPSHNRGYAVVGLQIMAFFGGIGGGVSRDICSMKSHRHLRIRNRRVSGHQCVGALDYQYADSKEEGLSQKNSGVFQVVHAALVCHSWSAQIPRSWPTVKKRWKSIGRVFLFALAIDVIYQIIVLRFVYPGEAIMAATVLAIIPYLTLRGLVTRAARRWRDHANTTDKGPGMRKAA